MSQPPQQSPYSVPQVQTYPYGYDPYGQLGASEALAPARRASVLMFILGGLLVLLGACNGISGLLVDADEMMAQNQQLFATGQPSPIAPETMRALAIAFAVLTFFVGVGMIVLGTRVRAGGRAAIITSLVLSSLIAFVLLGFELMSLVGAIVAPLILIFTCLAAIPLALFGLQAFLLIQALRRGTPSPMSQMQQQAAYWHYTQQQQRAYQQSVYAYQQQQLQQPPPPPADASGNPPASQP